MDGCLDAIKNIISLTTVTLSLRYLFPYGVCLLVKSMFPGFRLTRFSCCFINILGYFVH